MKYSWLLLLICTAAMAAPSASTQREIEQLFGKLEQSGCRFNRNGSWYDAHAAADHLRGKYQYLQKHDKITDTESFVTQAASVSSQSGQPYRVQCGSSPEVDSADWFRQALTTLRGK